MVTPAHLQAPLTDLLTELEAAVCAGDRARATELEGNPVSVHHSCPKR